ncbi:DsbA family protein [Thiohalorhabdus sp.]|uniref:DsbA family protein n=1 Tax=Thiohalorhabdus sp. TaxID=3094134 RepID=UPI002FC31FBF
MKTKTWVGRLLAAAAFFAAAAPATAYDELAVEEKALRVLDTILPAGIETRDEGMKEAQVEGWVKVSYEAKSRRGWMPVVIFVHEDTEYALAGRLYSVAVGAEPREKAKSVLEERIPTKFERELIQDQVTPMEGLREYLFEVRLPQRGPQAVGVYVGDKFGVVGQLFGPGNDNLTQKNKQSWRGSLVSWGDLTQGLEPVYGEADAPVRFAMFTDPDCPACQRAKKRIENLVAQNGDRLAGYLLWLPLDMHDHAKPKSKVLACAPADSQARLFDALQDTKPNGVGEVFEVLKRKDAAVPGGVRSCIDSGEADRHLERVQQQADQVGLSSVPTVYFDGKVFRGFPEDAVKEALEAAGGG